MTRHFQVESTFTFWGISLLLPLRSPNIILILRETPFSLILQIPNSLLIHLSTYSSLFMHSLLYMRFCYWVKNILGEIGVKRPGSKELSKYILSNELSWKIAFWCFPWVNGMKNSKNNIILSNEMQKYPRYKACFSTEFEKKSIHIYFLPFDKFLKSVWNISCYDKNCREIIISFY